MEDRSNTPQESFDHGCMVSSIHLTLDPLIDRVLGQQAQPYESWIPTSRSKGPLTFPGGPCRNVTWPALLNVPR
jgi:hypothetical protein